MCGGRSKREEGVFAPEPKLGRAEASAIGAGG